MMQDGNGVFVLQPKGKDKLKFEMYDVKESESHLQSYTTLRCQDKQQICM